MALDTVYDAETPEGMSLRLRPAGLMSRCLAYLIDLGIRLVLVLMVFWVGSLLQGLGRALGLIAFFVLEWFYPVFFELSGRAATPGKQVMKLQVVMDTGLPITPAASILRNLLRAADFFPMLYGLGALLVLLRSDFKRSGDILAGTIVIYRESTQLHDEIPDAAPCEPVRSLRLDEQAAVLAWAARHHRLTAARWEELAALAAPVLSRTGALNESQGPTSTRLLGVAQWLLGRRRKDAP